MSLLNNRPIEDMAAIGCVRSDSARLWIRSSKPGTVEVQWHPEAAPEAACCTRIDGPSDSEADGTFAVEIPGPRGRPLEPMSRYVFHVRREQESIGEGVIETAPATPSQTPSRFTFALGSCHQPFAPDGTVRPDAEAMLRATRRCLHDRDAKFAMFVGDQMYSDAPAGTSLFDDEAFARIAPAGRERILDCTPEEIRRLYQGRYRHFWGMREWQAIQAELPCYMVWDDHDVVDNWGSATMHQEPPWTKLGEGARRAYMDYQASRVFDALERKSYHYAVEYGCIALFVMDLRAQRTGGEEGHLYSAGQREALAEFLEIHRHKPAIFIAVSVPPVHLPRFLSRIAAKITPPGEDFSDRWSSGGHIRDRDRLFRMLHAHRCRNPQQCVVLLSGDIHIGCVHRLSWNSAPEGMLVQMISSGITHGTTPGVAFASRALIRANRSLATTDGGLRAKVRLLKGEGANPFGQLNLGLVEVVTEDAGETATLHFELYGHRGDEPVRAFRSIPVIGRSA